MSWPTFTDYQESIQDPKLCFEPPGCGTAKPLWTPWGCPRLFPATLPVSMKCTGRRADAPFGVLSRRRRILPEGCHCSCRPPEPWSSQSCYSPFSGQSKTFSGHAGDIRCMAFNINGKYIASGGADQKVILWEVSSGEQVVQIQAHADGVLAIAFSPDNRLLVTGGGDNLVKLWELGALLIRIIQWNTKLH